MRTKEEIAKEIKALKALKPCGAWAAKTQASIDAAIEELEYGCDRTAEEWGQLSNSAQDAANIAEQWKLGDTNDKPSEGWGSLVEGNQEKKGKE